MNYILVQWPESQMLMEHERFHECLLVQDIDGHDEVGSSAYMCPEVLYNELFDGGNASSITPHKCEYCGHVGVDVEFQPNPFDQELNGDDTCHWMCEDCVSSAAGDI